MDLPLLCSYVNISEHWTELESYVTVITHCQTDKFMRKFIDESSVTYKIFLARPNIRCCVEIQRVRALFYYV